NEIVPLPSNVWSPNERTPAFEPVTWIVPLSVSPPLTRSAATEPEMVRSPFSVTPLVKVPEPLPASNSDAPSANATVPPLIVPVKFHDPVTAFSVIVEPVFVTVPVWFVTPPAPLIVPNPAVVTVPPRFSVASVTLIVPVLLQALPSVAVPPLIAWNVPPLLKLPLTDSVSVCPATFAEITPLLTRLLVPPISN